ncbi:MAG: phage tail tape measure protein, partial [Planctomycetes bacterium]|nr:phage tail tape measure protein [Planctomycetota bacterium]
LGGGTWINPNVGAARGAILAGETVRTFGHGGLFAGQTVRAYGDGGIPGVYNRPTYFRTANEELGVLGERNRPEGILPLQEGPEGLGVRLYGGAGAVTQTFAPNITIQVNNPKSKAEAQAGAEAALPAIRREMERIAKGVYRAQAHNSNSRSQIARMARSRA